MNGLYYNWTDSTPSGSTAMWNYWRDNVLGESTDMVILYSDYQPAARGPDWVVSWSLSIFVSSYRVNDFDRKWHHLCDSNTPCHLVRGPSKVWVKTVLRNQTEWTQYFSRRLCTNISGWLWTAVLWVKKKTHKKNNSSTGFWAEGEKKNFTQLEQKVWHLVLGHVDQRSRSVSYHVFFINNNNNNNTTKPSSSSSHPVTDISSAFLLIAFSSIVGINMCR